MNNLIINGEGTNLNGWEYLNASTGFVISNGYIKQVLELDKNTEFNLKYNIASFTNGTVNISIKYEEDYDYFSYIVYKTGTYRETIQIRENVKELFIYIRGTLKINNISFKAVGLSVNQQNAVEETIDESVPPIVENSLSSVVSFEPISYFGITEDGGCKVNDIIYNWVVDNNGYIETVTDDRENKMKPDLTHSGLLEANVFNGYLLPAVFARGIDKWVEPEPEIFESFNITINSGSDSQFILPTTGRLNNTNNTYNWIVNWGDGTSSQHSGTGTTISGILHNYPNADAEYIINIKPQDKNEVGWLRAFGMNSIGSTGSNATANRQKIKRVDSLLTENMVRTNINDTRVCAYMFYGCSKMTMGELFNIDTEITIVSDYFMAYMFSGCLALNMNERFNIPQKINVAGYYFLSYTFNNCSSLIVNSIFNIPQEIDYCRLGFMGSTFYGCSKFTMNTVFNLPQNVTSVDYDFCNSTFEKCIVLRLNAIFNLPQKATATEGGYCPRMFYGCNAFTFNGALKLPSVSASSFSFVDFLRNTFDGCYGITGGVSNFMNTRTISALYMTTYPTAFNYTFNGCYRLNEDLSNIPQFKIIPTARKYTFLGCPADTIAPLHANWK